MLSYQELEDVARIKRLSLVNAEKDYLQDVVLLSVYTRMSDEIVFKGGTCLYKFYKLNRFSEDLDFTLRKRINFRKNFDKVLADIELLNIKGTIKEIKEYKNAINIRLLLNGPLYKGSKTSQCFIPLNISMKENIVLNPKKESVISMYKEIPNFEVFIMQEQEILAEKVRAILTREKPRDIYDLWFLLSKKNTAFKLALVNKKLNRYDFKFNLQKFVAKINKGKGLWDLDLKNLVLKELPDFNRVKKEILAKI